VRFRLNKPEVAILAKQGFLEAQTNFGSAVFFYAIKADTASDTMHADLESNRIVLYVPEGEIINWPDNDKVSIRFSQDLKNGKSLSLLLEKDFVCLDDTDEDQSDNYENPNAICK
jgi:hypothetical protein